MKMFLENAKKPLRVVSFSSFVVNLESFKKICNATYSLFAVLQKVNSN